MKWIKMGLVWGPKGDQPFARSHAMVPTPLVLSDEVIRVFVTCCDEIGRGRPIWVDVDASEPSRVLGVSPCPLLDIGRPGSFDDNGVLCTCVIPLGPDKLFMYYVGFETLEKIRYRLFTGMAQSWDGGDSFVRTSEAPVLDRVDGELYFRGGPFVICSETNCQMWYVSGNTWIAFEDKALPVYDLKYMESSDGLKWPGKGKTVLPLTGEDEHGFGRPWILKRGEVDYQLFYSIRKKSVQAYRLGYAESSDGMNWLRMDEKMGLDVSATGFDNEAIMYSAVISVHDRTFCFYNGNNFGKDGFAVAELVEE